MKGNSIVNLSALMLLSNTTFSTIVIDLSQGKEMVMKTTVMPGASEMIEIKKMTPNAAAFCIIETVGVSLGFTAAPTKAFPADGTTHMTFNKHNDTMHVINITTNHSPLAVSSSNNVYDVQSIKAILAPNTTGNPVEVKIVAKYLSIDATAPAHMQPKAEKVDLTSKDSIESEVETFTTTAESIYFDVMKLINDTSSTPENVASTGREKIRLLEDKIGEGKVLLANLISPVLKSKIEKSVLTLEDIFRKLQNKIWEAQKENISKQLEERKKDQAIKDQFFESQKAKVVLSEILRLRKLRLNVWDTKKNMFSPAYKEAFNDLLKLNDKVTALDIEYNKLPLIHKDGNSRLREAYEEVVNKYRKAIKEQMSFYVGVSFTSVENIWAIYGGIQATSADIRKSYPKKTKAKEYIYEPIRSRLNVLIHIRDTLEPSWGIDVANLDAHIKTIKDYLTHFTSNILPGLDD